MRHEQWIKVYSPTQYSVLSDMKTVGECTDTSDLPSEVETGELGVGHGSERGVVTAAVEGREEGGRVWGR